MVYAAIYRYDLQYINILINTQYATVGKGGSSLGRGKEIWIFTCYKILIHVAIYWYNLQYINIFYINSRQGRFLSGGAGKKYQRGRRGRHFHLGHDSLLFSFHFAKPIVTLLLILAAVIACNEPAEGKQINSPLPYSLPFLTSFIFILLTKIPDLIARVDLWWFDPYFEWCNEWPTNKTIFIVIIVMRGKISQGWLSVAH